MVVPPRSRGIDFEETELAILAAAVVVVGVLCLVDLLLTVGVIRRLRVHTELLSRVRGEQGGDIAITSLGAGAIPGSFTGQGSAGEPVTGPAGWRMAAFFSSTCSACPEKVPGFVDYVRARHLERGSVLAVVATADAAEPVPYLDSLAAVAHVCQVPHGSEPEKAFKVAGFPAFFLLDETGAVQAASYDPAALPELAVA
jgi:hypothetical protein